MTTFTNDFHRTETTVKANAGDTISAKTLARVERELCGMSDCTCGGIRGGRYTVHPTNTQERYLVVDGDAQ